MDTLTFMRNACLVLLMVFVLTSTSQADQFESIDGKALLATTKGPEAKLVDRLTMRDLGALPNLLKETRATLLIATTTKGNVTRLLVTPELRKPEGGGEPFPVFLLERFDTFDIEDLSARIAKGREMVLFPGFQVDLDTAQVVPEGRGGDLAFVNNNGLALVALKGAKLYTLEKAPDPDPTKPPQPIPGRSVVPRDFAGRYRLFANGQWSATLDLAVASKNEVTGQFRSDTHGSSYPVTGEVAVDVPNKVTMTVKFPRARGEFEGYLWTEGKGAMAGTFRLNDRTFGFFAIREGGRFAPEGTDVGRVITETDPPLHLVVEVTGDQIRFQGKNHSPEALTAVLRLRKDRDKPSSISLRASESTSYESVRHALDAIGAAGFPRVELAPIATKPD